MSARSRARRARSTEWCSVPRSVRAGRRRPAVSMKQTGPSAVSTTVSMASRVVPGMSCTMERSSPRSLLKSVDLPTLGRPMMATRGVDPGPGGGSAAASSSARRHRGRQQVDHGIEQVAGAPSVQGADREGIPDPEGDELPGRRLPVGVVDLVDHQPYRGAGLADELGRGQVLVGDARW